MTICTFKWIKKRTDSNLSKDYGYTLRIRSPLHQLVVSRRKRRSYRNNFAMRNAKRFRQAIQRRNHTFINSHMVNLAEPRQAGKQFNRFIQQWLKELKVSNPQLVDVDEKSVKQMARHLNRACFNLITHPSMIIGPTPSPNKEPLTIQFNDISSSNMVETYHKWVEQLKQERHYADDHVPVVPPFEFLTEHIDRKISFKCEVMHNDLKSDHKELE